MSFEVFRRPLPVTRTAEGQYVDGYWQPDATSSLTISASVQPVKANEIDALPEGRRERSAFWLYSGEAFQSTDRVEIGGESYEIVQVNPYQNGVVPHYKSLAVKNENR